MDPKQFETFLDLMETRSFNRTAERLNITQSTVSHRVRALEASVGKSLFVRSRSGTEPTLAGRRFLDHARGIRQYWREAVRHVETTGRFDRMIRVGLQHDVADALAGEMVQTIRMAMPEISLNLEVDYSIQMVEDMLKGELDLAVVFTPRHHPDIYVSDLGSLGYQMVSTEPCSIEDVTAEHYIFPDISPAFGRDHRLRFPQLSETPLVCGQSQAICQLLRSVGGVSMVSLTSAQGEIAAGRLHPVKGAARMHHPIYVAINLRNRHVQTHRRIIAIVHSQLALVMTPSQGVSR